LRSSTPQAKTSLLPRLATERNTLDARIGGSAEGAGVNKAGSPVLRVPSSQTPLPEAPFHTWKFPDDTPWAEFYRESGGYRLRFPGLADFSLTADGNTVTAIPVPGVSEGTIQHLYLNQVLPLSLSKQGKLVFHASAVEFGSGALAFIGPTGRGKSTLAASFAISGHRFLTDDGLVLAESGEGYDVLPSHPSIRLWHDSEKQLIPPDVKRATPLCYTTKARLLSGGALSYCDSPRALRRAYFLGDGTAKKIEFRPINPTEALIEWVRFCFLLDIEEQPLVAAHFDHVARLAAQPIHFRLDFPRHYRDLHRVRRAIIEHAGGDPSPD